MATVGSPTPDRSLLGVHCDADAASRSEASHPRCSQLDRNGSGVPGSIVGRKMARISKSNLLGKVTAALRDAGWSVEVHTERDVHPMLLTARQAGRSLRLRVYIWNLTHGGGSARPKHEYRIQVTSGVTQFQRLAGEHTLILGWSELFGVFACFDFERHQQVLGSSPSFQISAAALESGKTLGIAAREKSNGAIAVSARPTFLADYVEHRSALHSADQVQQTIDAIRARQREQTSSEPKIDEATFETVLKKVLDGIIPQFGSPAEQTQRAEVHERLEQVEQALEQLRAGHGMIGHNQPPSDQQIGSGENEALEASHEIKRELSKLEPSVVIVAQKGRALFRLAQLWKQVRTGTTSAGRAIAEKAQERAAEAVVTVAISTAGGVYHESIGTAVHAAAVSIASWLSLVIG